MIEILSTAKIPEKHLATLNLKKFDIEFIPNPTENLILKTITDKEILIVRSNLIVNKKILNQAAKLKIIGRLGVGLDNIDLEETNKRNIKVLSTPKASSQSVAELVFGIILNLSRKIILANNLLKNHQWKKEKLVGQELAGKTLGIIGLGNIGQIVAKIGQAFRMEIIGYDPFWKLNQFRDFKIQQALTLNKLLVAADIVTIHIPKTPETINLINQKNLKIMKKNALLLNCARGGIVNETDLYHALKNRIIAGAGIDTWEKEPCTESPLFKLPNVIALPHLGASTMEAQDKCYTDLIEQITEIYS